jgi:hypothetical protein
MGAHHEKERETRELVILTKLAAIGPLNMLEIGFSASPQTIRNMAARGLVRVTVEATQRGSDHLEKIQARRKRQAVNEAKAARLAGGAI